MGLPFCWRCEALAETVDARIILQRFGPARGIEVAGCETGRALAGLPFAFAMPEVIERLDVLRKAAGARRTADSSGTPWIEPACSRP